MIPPILHRLRSRLSDVLTASVYGLDADREAARGLAEWNADLRAQVSELLRRLSEARRIAHEQEDRAEKAERLRESWRGLAERATADRAEEKRRADRLQQRIDDIEAAPDAS